MTQIGWGGIEEYKANVGKPFDKQSDFTEVTYSDACSERYKSYTHAAHAMIFARIDEKLWNLFPKHACIMMQTRFDGSLGFIGGLIDPGETPVEALTRECVEEIALDVKNTSFTQDEHVISHANKNKNFVTHFFAKEVTYENYCNIEKNTMHAKEWGVETFGVIRVPLMLLGDGVRGFPVFLSNTFAGNAKAQMIHTIRKFNIIPEDQLKVLLDAADKYMIDIKS